MLTDPQDATSPTSVPAPTDTTTPEPSITYGKDQPLAIRLKYGSPLHGKVVGRLKSRLDLSSRKMATRREDWDRVDEKRRLYVNLARPARKGDKTVDPSKRENPFDRSIVMPMTFAIHETRKANLISQFLFRSPFNQLDGRGGDPANEKAAKYMESKLDYDFTEGNGTLSIYSLLQDADAYGIGVVHDYWDEVEGQIVQRQPPSIIDKAISMITGKPAKDTFLTSFGPIKQLTRWMPVDPYLWWPDPRVSASNIQDGEFAGFRTFRSFLWLLERRQDEQGNGIYFNLDAVKSGTGAATRMENPSVAGNQSRSGAVDDVTLRNTDEKDKGYYVVDFFAVKLIPKDWELGDSTLPEVWWFSMADESVIIRAHKSDYAHNQLPFSAAEVLPDPHQLSNPGTLELLDGIQRTIDWLANSRIENVMKFLNDAFVYAPTMLEAADVLNPGPARWMRLTKEGEARAMQGVGIDSMFKQLDLRDVTGTHMEIIAALAEWGNKIGASNDPAQGQALPEKRTLGEVNLANAGSSQRMSVVGRLIDAQAFAPLAMRAVSNAQQFTSIEQWIRLTGMAAQIDPEGFQRVLIDRDKLQGNFDYVPHSSMSPSDPARQMAVWEAVLNTAMTAGLVNVPQADGTMLNVKELFNWICRLGGAREIDRFWTQMPTQPGAIDPTTGQPIGGAPGVLPDEEIQQGVQAGNLVPVQGSGLQGRPEDPMQGGNA